MRTVRVSVFEVIWDRKYGRFCYGQDVQKIKTKRSCPEMFSKKGVIRNFTKFTGKLLCQSLFFNKVSGLKPYQKNEALAQVFSREFCEITKNTTSYKTPAVATSGKYMYTANDGIKIFRKKFFCVSEKIFQKSTIVYCYLFSFYSLFNFDIYHLTNLQ